MIFIDNINVLNFAIEQGIINYEDIKRNMEMKKKEELLALHTYSIWLNKEDEYCTYILDDCGERKLKRRKTKKELDDFLIKFYKEKEENPSVYEVYVEWVERKLQHNEIEQQTKERYDREFQRNLKEFGKRKIKNITPDDIEDLIFEAIAENKLSAKAYSNMRTILYGMFKRAKKRKFVSFSITEVIKDMEISAKRFSKKVIDISQLIYTEEEVSRIGNYIDSKERDVLDLGIILLFKSGMRPGELSALKYEDISEKVIHVRRTEIKYNSPEGKGSVYEVRNYPKTEAGIRDIVLPSNAAWIINEIKQLNPNGEYVFEVDGQRVKSCQFDKRIRKICNKLDIVEKSLNKIRKTYATILIDSDVDESLIISQMGHTDIKTTKGFYYKDRKNVKEKIAIIDNVEGL